MEKKVLNEIENKIPEIYIPICPKCSIPLSKIFINMHLKYYCEHCEKDDNNIFDEREIFDIDGKANFDSDEGRINEPYREYWDYYPKLNPINISNLKFHKIKNHSELIKYFFCKKHNKIFTKYCERSGKNDRYRNSKKYKIKSNNGNSSKFRSKRR